MLSYLNSEGKHCHSIMIKLHCNEMHTVIHTIICNQEQLQIESCKNMSVGLAC